MVVFPVAALVIAYFLVINITSSKNTGGGSHRLLEVYHYEGGKMSLRSTLIEPLASAITIGLGGSAGFEGPSLLLGGGLGSYIGQKLDLSTDELSTMLICGARVMVSDLLREDSLTLNADMNFREALKMVSKNPFSEYPVVSEGILVSSITLEDILFNLDNARSLKELDSEPFIAQINDSLISLVESLSEGEYDCCLLYTSPSPRDRS